MSVLSDEVLNDPANVGYATMTDAQVAAALNTKTIAVKKQISSIDIERYLLLQDKLIPLQDSVDIAARTAVLALQKFREFDIRVTVYEAKLMQILDSLIAIGLLNTADKTAILAMGDTTISKATQLGLAEVSTADIQKLRGTI